MVIFSRMFSTARIVAQNMHLRVEVQRLSNEVRRLKGNLAGGTTHAGFVSGKRGLLVGTPSAITYLAIMSHIDSHRKLSHEDLELSEKEERAMKEYLVKKAAKELSLTPEQAASLLGY